MFRLTIIGLAVLGLAAQTVTRSVQLSWTASTSNEQPLAYNVYRSDGPCSTATEFAKVNTAPITGTTFTQDTVPLGRYCYRATAFWPDWPAIAESAPSNTVQADVSPTAPPSPPSGLTITFDIAVSGKITVANTPVSPTASTVPAARFDVSVK